MRILAYCALGVIFAANAGAQLVAHDWLFAAISVAGAAVALCWAIDETRQRAFDSAHETMFRSFVGRPMRRIGDEALR